MTQTQKKVKRTIRAVFAQYRETRTDLLDNDREIVATARRGETVEVAESEAKRLDALGSTEEAFAAQAVMDRALSADVPTAPDADARITASPPGRGVAPAGELVLPHGGEGSGAPVPDPEAGGTTTTTTASFDARGASLDEVTAWLRDSSPNATQTVEAANGDAEAAEVLLEAERIVRDGDPRSTVTGPLQKVVDKESAGS